MSADDKKNRATHPSELFYYAAQHQALICVPCQYAIQPSAIPRHLKDIHHIYRRKRDPFTVYAKTLKLKRPQDVTPPAGNEFPVPHLLVEPGWRCTYSTCEYMCVSTKRMQMHWSSEHGRRCDPDHNMEPVQLQTFFRGKLLQYFTNSHRPRVPGPTVITPLLQQQLQTKHNLDRTDQILLQHYFDSAHKSFVTNKQTESIWLQLVPQLAYKNEFLLHGILACAALHMAYLDSDQRQYAIRACVHQEMAIPSFREAIGSPTEQNCDAILAFAYFLVVYSFATDGESSHNSLLLINDYSDGKGKQTLIIPQWLHFIRVGCYMLRDVWDKVQNGPASVLAMAWEVAVDVGGSELPYLGHFIALVPDDSSWSEESVSVYHASAVQLAKSFAFMDKIGMDSGVSTWTILGMWPVTVDDGYIDLLYERHPGALILLAYYCIILKEMQQRWYFAGRAAKLMTTIVDLLDARWKLYIEDAIRIVLDEDG